MQVLCWVRAARDNFGHYDMFGVGAEDWEPPHENFRNVGFEIFSLNNFIDEPSQVPTSTLGRQGRKGRQGRQGTKNMEPYELRSC